MTSDVLTTIVSANGGVSLPKSIRDKLAWKKGTRLVIEETTQGIILRQESSFARTRPEDVFGSLHVPGRKPVTLEEMDEAITAEVLARHARGRY
jgi:AbrB family looped-hinge helix DNA binding protein